MGHSIEAVTRLALAHPHIHFTLTHNGRTVHDLPPVPNIHARIAAFFGERAGERPDRSAERERRDFARWICSQPDA